MHLRLKWPRRLTPRRPEPKPQRPSLRQRLGGLLDRLKAFPYPRPRRVPTNLMWDGERLQLPADGVGPLFQRRYCVDIRRSRLSAKALMRLIQRNLPAFCPPVLAEFTKVEGHPQRMRVGDEYDIKILGPWNGSVRVVDVRPTSFALVTLRGHPEAGQIRFRISRHPLRWRALRFEILSWARSRDMLVSLTYHEGKLGKEVQKNAWMAFCEHVVEASKGRKVGEIQVFTEERDFTEEVVPLG